MVQPRRTRSCVFGGLNVEKDSDMNQSVVAVLMHFTT